MEGQRAKRGPRQGVVQDGGIRPPSPRAHWGEKTVFARWGQGPILKPPGAEFRRNRTTNTGGKKKKKKKSQRAGAKLLERGGTPPTHKPKSGKRAEGLRPTGQNPRGEGDETRKRREGREKRGGGGREEKRREKGQRNKKAPGGVFAI